MLYRMIVFILTSVSIFLFSHSSVFAHTSVIGITPKEGEVLTVQPEQIILEFSEPVTGNVVNIELLDPSAKRVQVSKVEILDNRTKIKVKIPNLNNGTYTVRWSMISADGHPSEGGYPFSIGEEVQTNVVVEGNVSGSGSVFSDVMIVILRYIVEGMILIGAGVKWLDMFVKRYSLPPILQRMKNMKKIFFSILVVGLIAELIVYKSIMPKGSLLIHSPFSVIIMIQLLLLVLMSLQHMGNEWYALIWGFLVASFSFTGHVWITNPNWAAVIIRMVHVMSIAVWLGALIYLALVIAWTTLYKITFDQKSFRKHFSIIAGISFILAFLSGELIVFLQTRNWMLLNMDSVWTNLLNIKAVTVLIITIVAWRQTKTWGNDIGTVNRRLLLLEIVLAILVLLAGIWMSQVSFPVNSVIS
ncbi:copper resistance protein CopC [Bacillus mobilis]|uniref:Copper-binding protein n=2 Tax=Bacillus cereus group TaxID=86661 RepID=A0A1C4BKY7_BACCE|nr:MULTISPECIES: copper resistance protein CopC [Bacillus cereus group]MCC2462374.1 copper resistance protein CopC/CopD [Bacillus mobilis]MCU5432931.1 copper resistance protein CopC/CopD [Bacillus mobilis]MCU5593023.1 copper resistance protein CopC/CopD [Bacillus mobilis]MCU5737955.1 copper resistance protein CopC/CopD [Bacillus mobilis]MCU9559025.1 copper resistance protein CopC/CopD [Bacillus mobilis]